jgi:hypothetical protein
MAQLMLDFGLDPSKNPKFLMLTGLADLRTGQQTTLSASVVYVVELSTGKICMYALPWNRTRWIAGMPITADLVHVGTLPFRAQSPLGPAPKIGGAKAGKEKE